MTTILKIAGLSAVMAAGLVTAMEASSAKFAPTSGKLFHDRVAADAPADRPAPATAIRVADASGALMGPAVARATKSDAARPDGRCAARTWPNVTPDCIVANGETAPGRQVRTISLETRSGANVTVLLKAR